MSLFDELKRRNVFRVGAAYLALGWIVTQVTATVTPMMRLPEWVAPTVLWVGVIGFPFVLLFSWIYELTPEGLKRESEIARDSSITNLTARRLDTVIIAMLGVAILLFVADRFVPRSEAPVGAGPVVGAGPARDGTVGAGMPATEPVPAESSRASALPQQQQATPIAAAPDPKSIAVLPFVNMSSDKEQEYFSDGISEELLNLLVKIPELRVIARTSSFSYKGKEIKIADVGRELNVANVLEGSVRKSGNKVRITAQLVRTSDSTHLWSQTFDRALDDIFAVQDEIAAAVVEQMKIKLLGEAPKARVVKPEAYSLLLQARQVGRMFSAEGGFTRSNSLYEQALAIDSSCAECLRGLAANYMNEVGFGKRPIDEGYRMAREAIDKALAIDPEFARAHDGLAWIAMTYDRDLAAAARYWEHALALEPGNLDIIGNASILPGRLGRIEQSIAMTQYGVERDPLDVIGLTNLAALYLTADRIDDALATLRTASSLNPRFLGVQAAIGEALLRAGELQSALEAASAEPDELSRLVSLAEVHHAHGEREKSDAVLVDLIGKYGEVAPFSVAIVLAYRGEADRAFEWLNKAAQAHDPSIGFVMTSWQCRELHRDPRWLPLLRGIGVAPEQLAAISFEVKLPE